jgi:hypothetical protein
LRRVDTCKIGWTQQEKNRGPTDTLNRYKQTKLSIERIFSTHTDAPSVHLEGFGSSIYYNTVTKNAFFSAIGSIVSEDESTAKQIAEDIHKHSLETITPDTLFEGIRKISLITLCRPESSWPLIWPSIAEKIISFLTFLDISFERSCDSLSDLISMLRNLNSKLNVICIGGRFSEASYATCINKLFPFLNYINCIFFPVSSDDIFGNITVPYSRLFDIVTTDALAEKERAFINKQRVFPLNSYDFWLHILSSSNAYLKYGNTDSTIEKLFTENLNRTDLLNLDTAAI